MGAGRSLRVGSALGLDLELHLLLERVRQPVPREEHRRIAQKLASQRIPSVFHQDSACRPTERTKSLTRGMGARSDSEGIAAASETQGTSTLLRKHHVHCVVFLNDREVCSPLNFCILFHVDSASSQQVSASLRRTQQHQNRRQSSGTHFSSSGSRNTRSSIFGAFIFSTNGRKCAQRGWVSARQLHAVGLAVDGVVGREWGNWLSRDSHWHFHWHLTQLEVLLCRA